MALQEVQTLTNFGFRSIAQTSVQQCNRCKSVITSKMCLSCSQCCRGEMRAFHISPPVYWYASRKRITGKAFSLEINL